MENLKLKDFLDYKYISNTKYSPDGKHVAYVISKSDEEHNEYQNCLYLWNGKTHRQLTSFGKEMMYFWEDNETLVVANMRTKDDLEAVKNGEELTVFYQLHIHGGEAIEAFRIPLLVSDIKKACEDVYIIQVAYDLLYSHMYALSNDEKQKVIKERKELEDYEILDELPFYGNGRGYTNKIRSSLFSFHRKTRNIKRMSDELVDVSTFEVDERGNVYYVGEAVSSKRTYKDAIYKYDLKSKQNIVVLEKDAYSVQDIQPYNQQLLVLASDNEHFGVNENAKFYILNEDKKELQLLANNEEALGSSVGSDARYGGGSYKDVAHNNFYFITTRVNSSHIYKLDKDGFSSPVLEVNGSVDCLSIHDETIVFTGMLEGKLQELYSCHLDGSNLQQVSNYNEEVIQNKDIRPYVACNITQDGMTIYGWVLTPSNYDETKSYPAILDIHGGPKTVYGEVFYHEMQVWANMGYFVFFMNPRGSDGRGNEFADIRGKYGTIDYDDIMKFTDCVLTKYPAIDASRVGVTGGSYGGFMTNWIIGHTNRFKAAASQRSISNWLGFAHTSDIGEMFASDQQAANTWSDYEKLWWHSPLKYADKCSTPTLFIHSNEDYRCPLSEGIQMYSALCEHGVDTRLVMFKGENHELSRSGKPKHRVKRLEEITIWMERYLK